ncbi:MAG: hypothetical protein ABR915_21350, partial [Thermoguttaceae bacterium]
KVLTYDAKVYYVVTQGARIGDSIRRLPVNGNETVLDAIASVNGLSQLSSKRIWIARPAPGKVDCEQILPIDWDAITQGGETKTNYRILPGDRVFIAEQTRSLLGHVLDKFAPPHEPPHERVSGLMSTHYSTTPGFQTMGREYNRSRSGF